ncbi:hypothetical protein RQP46_001327 [Phenoliferia psychrophenolica]
MVSFLEVKSKKTLEKCVDLFVERKKGDKEEDLFIDSDGIVKGLTKVSIATFEDFTSRFAAANKRRSTASTALNSSSSRSHAVLTITVTTPTSFGRVTFIDLAGIESNKKAGNVSHSDRWYEANTINESLTNLALLVRNLNTGLDVLYLYRASKLTLVMKDFLGKDASGLLICNVAPGTSYHHTLQTLEFGLAAQKVQRRAVPPSKDAARISNLEALVARLRADKMASRRAAAGLEKKGDVKGKGRDIEVDGDSRWESIEEVA